MRDLVKLLAQALAAYQSRDAGRMLAIASIAVYLAFGAAKRLDAESFRIISSIACDGDMALTCLSWCDKVIARSA
jgi:hypothetical protein